MASGRQKRGRDESSCINLGLLVGESESAVVRKSPIFNHFGEGDTGMSTVDMGNGIYVTVGGAFPKCNTLVIKSGELVVVDPGCSVEALRSLLVRLNLELRDIDTIVLSHIHPDHITNTMRLNRLSKCRIAANEITAPLFNDKEKMKQFLGFHQGHPVRRLWEEMVNERMHGALDPGHVDEVLSNGDKIALNDLTLKMLLTPGHLPDHMCIEITEPQYLFGADIDCTPFGPFYGHPNSSIDSFKDTLQNLQETDYSCLISGHLENPVVKDYKSALHDYSAHFDTREEKVLRAVKNGARTINDIMVNPIIYPSLSSPVMLQFERWMIEHHLESLARLGKLTETDKGFSVPTSS